MAPTPTKAEQEMEAAARRKAAGVTEDQADAFRAENADAVANMEDGADGSEGSQPQQRPPQEEPPAPRERAMSPGDKARMEMAARFRRPAEEEQPFSGDINDPEVIFGEAARQQLEPEPGEGEDLLGTPVGDNEPAPQPRMVTIKVNGKNIQVTEDELIERAQKVSAADSYLDEAKTLLRQAKEIKRGRSGAADDDQDQIDDGGQDRDQLDQPVRQPVAQNPERLKQVIEKIQFGDQEEAAAALGEVIAEAADQSADQRQLERLMNNDLARSQKSLKSFVEANPELANNEIFSAGMEATMYRLYREEIEALGVVEPDKIPKDRATLANWHRWYRVHGAEVSQADTLLTKAKDQVLQYMKVPGQPTQQRREPSRAQPRVAVNVDRTERRASIPVQPSRSVAPRPNTQTRPPAEQGRSSVVSEMRRARGQPVG